MSVFASWTGLEGGILALLVKATVVVLSAWTIAWLLRRASAATRHMIWTGAVLALLGLPALVAFLPRLEVPAPSVVVTLADQAGGSRASVMETEVRPRRVGFPDAIGGLPVDADAGSHAVVGANAASAGRSETVADPWRPIATVWLLGTALLVLRLLVGTLGVRRLERTATLVKDPEWDRLLHDVRWLLDVERPVRLLRSPAMSIPVTWGTLRPTVLLPADADDWSEDRKRVVLLHEVAHIARRDCFTQLLASIATAIYWVHPLAWVAARRLRVERERACDDLVLGAGEEPSEYASHLLDVARSFQADAPVHAAAIAMARPTQLEGRLLALLDDARSRSRPDRRARLAGGGLAALALIPLAAVSVVEGGSDPTAPSSLVTGLVGLQLSPALPAEPVAPGLAVSAALVRNAATAADTTIELRMAAAPAGSVRLNIRTGGRVRVTGWDRAEIFVQASLRGPLAEQVEVVLEETANGVELLSRYSQRSVGDGDHEFEVFVPAHSDIELHSAGGDFTARSVSGSLEGMTGGGEVVLEGLTGEMNLQTGGGNVRVTDSTLDGVVRTGGGNITLNRVTGGLAAHTAGGNISVTETVPGDPSPRRDPLTYVSGGGNIDLDQVGTTLEAATGGGNISIVYAADGVNAETGGGVIRLGEVLGPVSARTGAGDVHIGRAGSTVGVATGAGAISVNLARGVRDADIDLSSADGPITLTLPADFSGVFELTGPAHRQDWVQSDFDLTHDSSGHATGRVGDGANRVRIHAMNGNIVLLRGDGHSIGLRRGEGSVDSSDARRAASARAESFSYNSPGEDHFDFEFAFDEERWSRFAAQVALQAADIASAAADVGLDAALASLEALRLDE